MEKNWKQLERIRAKNRKEIIIIFNCWEEFLPILAYSFQIRIEGALRAQEGKELERMRKN